GPMKAEDVKAVLNRLYTYLDETTPAKVIDQQTKTEITDLKKLTPGTSFGQGVFRLVSYEWGVTYGAMLLAGDATGDPKFRDYTVKRLDLISAVSQYYKSLPTDRQRNN